MKNNCRIVDKNQATKRQMELAFLSGIPSQAPICSDEGCKAYVKWDSSARKKLGNWRGKCNHATSCKKCLQQGKRIHKEHCTCNK